MSKMSKKKKCKDSHEFEAFWVGVVIGLVIMVVITCVIKYFNCC